TSRPTAFVSNLNTSSSYHGSRRSTRSPTATIAFVSTSSLVSRRDCFTNRKDPNNTSNAPRQRTTKRPICAPSAESAKVHPHQPVLRIVGPLDIVAGTTGLRDSSDRHRGLAKKRKDESRNQVPIFVQRKGDDRLEGQEIACAVERSNRTCQLNRN